MKHVHGAVWMIIPTYYPVVGGAQVQVQQLSQAFTAQGWAVTILTRQHSYAHPEGLPAAEERDDIPVRRIFSRGSGKTGAGLFLLNGLWFLLRHGRQGIYHAHDTGAAGWLAVAARYLYGGRCLVKLRTGRTAYEQSLRSRLARWQFQALLRGADRVLVVSQEMQAYLKELGMPADRVAWVPNGVDVERFCPAQPGQKAQARIQLGMRESEQILLYVGRLEQLKGVDILLRAWKKLNPEQRLSSRLFLVGDGPERERLEAMARAFGIGDSVCFRGEQNDVLTYYQAADLFVLPSRTEGLSNALLEAMACELPVLVSNVGGAKDLVQEGQSGFFFPSEDEQELAGRLAALLGAPHAWPSIGRQARASVVANASLAATARMLDNIYQQLTESMHPTPLRRQESGE